MRGAFERYSIGHVFKLLGQHQLNAGKKPGAVSRSIFFARMGIVTAAETALLRYNPPEDGMEARMWEGPGEDASSCSPAACRNDSANRPELLALLAAGDCSAWEAAIHNMGVVTAYLMDSSSKPNLDVLTLFNHGAGRYLSYWVAQFHDKPPLTGHPQAWVVPPGLQGRVVSRAPSLCVCTVHTMRGAGMHMTSTPCLVQIFEFLSMLALQIPLLKPPVTRWVPSGTKQGLRQLQHMC